MLIDDKFICYRLLIIFLSEQIGEVFLFKKNTSA